MADKRFYEQAAGEVALGALDSALWIKVNAENPIASDIEKQAAYIRLRAAELAKESGQARIASSGFLLVPTTWWQWVIFLVVDFFACTFLFNAGDSGAPGRGDGWGLFCVFLFLALLGLAIWFGPNKRKAVKR